MPASGLLADLAIMMATSPEDVATKGLDLLLGRSPAASAAMNRLLMEWRGGQAGIPVSRWASQVVAADKSRTDLEGFSDTGETVAILENKFWAGLTDNQPAGYLQRLRESSGVLAFVVPDSRVRIMTHELSLRLAALHCSPCEEHLIGDTVLLRNQNQPTVVVTGWSAVLGALGSAMESAAEYDNHADLRQLQGLATRMDVEGFRPFRQSDLTGDTPALINRLCKLLDSAVQILLTTPYANKKGLKASAGQGWYGHYLRLHGYGCRLVVSTNIWAANGVSPMWLLVSSRDWRFPPLLGAPLRAAAQNERWVVEDHGNWAGYWLPIRILEDRDRDAVLRDIAAQIDRIAAVLGSYPEAESEVVPPEVA